MNEPSQSKKYEDNYIVLEKITESLNRDEIGIDDLVEKTREALDAARNCMDILNKQKGEFQKLETEFSQLLQSTSETTPAQNPAMDTPNHIPPAETQSYPGDDDPF
jgi:exonuclease VII small subunit